MVCAKRGANKLAAHLASTRRRPSRTNLVPGAAPRGPPDRLGGLRARASDRAIRGAQRSAAWIAWRNSLTPKEPSRRAAMRPSRSIVNSHGSVWRWNALSGGRGPLFMGVLREAPWGGEAHPAAGPRFIRRALAETRPRPPQRA